jgi:peroxiredoxin
MAETPVAVGQSAPDFNLLASTQADRLTLSDLRGKIVVLAFYVLDFTST